MRAGIPISAVAALLLVSHHGLAVADELDDVIAADESASSTTVALPQFTPTSLKAPFLEQFTSNWSERWTPSSAKKDDKDGKEEMSYVGKWSVEEPTVLKGLAQDLGLVLKSPAAHHAISAPFPEPIDNTDKTLVVQYEVKLQKGLECGGAYLKLLSADTVAGVEAQEFSNNTPYQIMFGPDKCGATNKVHFIFRHRNPKTGEYEEKHLTAPPPSKITKLSTLYTLIVNPDQTFEIRINGDKAKSGSLLENFTPAVNPAAEIPDLEDLKPADWVDTPQIPDPTATKPADWDEDAPMTVPDMDVEKPEDWLEEEPEYIPDPDAEKPEDWDDEEDGDWIAPTVPNPKCETASGCGPWIRPLKRNPDYKGKWSAPLIPNPDYKGIWEPRKIANPDYYEDLTPSNFEPIGAIGFELWTMQNDILFDNIYVGHSVEDAEALAEETWKVKYANEKAEEEQNIKATPEPPKQDSKGNVSPWKEDPLGYASQQLDMFYQIFIRDPRSALEMMPEVATAIIVGLVSLLATIGGLLAWLTAPAAKPSQVVKKAAENVKADAKAKKEQGQVVEKERIVAEETTASPVALAEEEKVTRRSTRRAE
ncbi:hypothetical protein YB2330_004747 [Saitoella coloradoensis]